MMTIITPIELKECSCIRQFGKHVSDDKIQAYIHEVEMLYVKPLIGDDTYIAIIEGVESDSETYKTLLSGGVYNTRQGKKRVFSGLKTAIAYYVYSQYVMSGDMESTRYGLVVKDGEYSSRISSKERSDCYNNALQVANGYMSECVEYMREVMGVCASESPKISGSVKIKKIG